MITKVKLLRGYSRYDRGDVIDVVGGPNGFASVLVEQRIGEIVGEVAEDPYGPTLTDVKLDVKAGAELWALLCTPSAPAEPATLARKAKKN